jgi:hypothetical protein
MRMQLAVLLLSFVACHDAAAIEVAVRAPVENHPECEAKAITSDPLDNRHLFTLKAMAATSCGGSISYKDALAGAEHWRETKLKCATNSEGDCETTSFSASVFSSQVSENCFPQQTWAFVEDVPDGKEALEQLTQFAQSGEVRDSRYQIVEIAEEGLEGQHLATCEVTAINGFHGPPRDCYTSAIINDKVTLLRVGNRGGGVMCYASGSFRASGAIDINFEIETAVSATKFSEEIHTTIRDEMEFQTRYEVRESDDKSLIESVAITSTAGLRDSKFLEAGWREAMDLNVNLLVNRDNITVHAYTQPMVCREASGNVADYRAANDAQRQIYADAIDKKIAAAIERACPAAVKVDNLKYKCP